MASVVFDLANEVKDLLNGATFSLPVDAGVKMCPIGELAETVDPVVSVLCRSQEIKNTSKKTASREVQIDIAIQKKIKEYTDVSSCMPFMDLSEEFIQFFRFKKIGSGTCISIENLPIYAPEHLNNFQVFTSVITLHIKVLL